MQTIKFLTVLAIFSLMLASCSKENLTTVEDNVPDVEVIDESSNGKITLRGSTITLGEVALATFIIDTTTNEVNNYSLSLESADLGATGAVFASAWGPAGTELELQETTYNDEVGMASTISQAGIDAFDAWVAAGSDPNTMPDLVSFMTQYDASGVSYTISNITATTADVVVSGDMIDDSGNTVTISGTFTATLYN
ncbi:MAG: hypothetical protein AAF990_16315 [Bacteroidota bacterium]